MIEFRYTGDHPIVYKGHNRNIVDGRRIFDLFYENGFKILFYQVAYGLAKYKNEDPLICRMIAKANQ